MFFKNSLQFTHFLAMYEKANRFTYEREQMQNKGKSLMNKPLPLYPYITAT